MKTALLAAFSVLLLTTPSLLAATDWVEIARSSDGTLIVEHRVGSYSEQPMRGSGNAGFGALFQVNRRGIIEPTFAYVPVADCEKGYGILVFMDVRGEITSRVDFVKGGSSVGSGVADYICNLKRQVDRINSTTQPTKPRQ